MIELEEKNFNDRLKSIRKLNKLTQEETAMKLNISLARYKRYEGGAVDTPSKVISCFCKLFNISSDFLLFGKDETDLIENIMTDIKNNTNIEVRLINGVLETTINTPLKNKLSNLK